MGCAWDSSVEKWVPHGKTLKNQLILNGRIPAQTKRKSSSASLCQLYSVRLAALTLRFAPTTALPPKPEAAKAASFGRARTAAAAAVGAEAASIASTSASPNMKRRITTAPASWKSVKHGLSPK